MPDAPPPGAAAKPDRPVAGWAPLAAGIFAAGGLFATVITFMVALTASGGLSATTLDDELRAGARFTMAWIGFTALGCGVVSALLLRMRELHPVRYDAPIFDVLSALMAAVTAALVLLIFVSGNAGETTLWLSLLLGAIGFTPLVVVMQPKRKRGTTWRW